MRKLLPLLLSAIIILNSSLAAYCQTPPASDDRLKQLINTEDRLIREADVLSLPSTSSGYDISFALAGYTNNGNAITRANLALCLYILAESVSAIKKKLAELVVSDQFGMLQPEVQSSVLVALMRPSKTIDWQTEQIVFKSMWINRGSLADEQRKWFTTKLREFRARDYKLFLPLVRMVLTTSDPTELDLVDIRAAAVELYAKKPSSFDWSMSSPITVESPTSDSVISQLLDLTILTPNSSERNAYARSILARQWRLWSDSFSKWDWRAQKAADSKDARIAENNLRKSFEKLGKLETSRGFSGFNPGECERYLDLVTLAGGWNAIDISDNSVQPLPSWYRDDVDGKALQAKLDQLVTRPEILPITAFAHYITRERRVLSVENWDHEEVLNHKVSEILSAADRIGFSRDTWTANAVVSAPPSTFQPLSNAVQAGFSKDDIDLRRALLLTLAGYFHWRADLRYRHAGIDLPQQPANFDKANHDYNVVIGKHGVVNVWAPQKWENGLGLFGRVLDLELESIAVDKSTLDDKVSEAVAIQSGRESMLAAEENLQRAKEIERKIKVAEVGIVKLKEAAADNRIKKAEFEHSASEWWQEARKNGVNAASIRKKKADYITDSLEKQKNDLKANVEKYSLQVQESADKVRLLQTNFKDLWNSLVEHRDDSQSSSFWDVFSSVVSAVSVVCLGVDVVSLAKAAINTIDAISSGDWSKAGGAIFGAVVSYAGAELTSFVSQQIGPIVDQAGLFLDKTKEGLSFLTTCMPSSIQELTQSLSGLSIDPGSLQKVVWQQAAVFAKDVGVSKLLGTSVDSILSKLNPGLGPQQLVEIKKKVQASAQSESIKAAMTAFERQNLLVAVQQKLHLDRDQLLQELTGVLASNRDMFETKVCDYLMELKDKGAVVDISAFKVGLGNARMEVAAKVSELTGSSIETAMQLIDDIKPSATDSPPLQPLPESVRTKCEEVEESIEKIKLAAKNFGSESRRDQLMTLVEKMKDQEMDKLSESLQNEISDIQQRFGDTLKKLSALRSTLETLTSDVLISEFEKEATKWDLEVTKNEANHAGALERAAYYAVADAMQQKKIAGLNVDVANLALQKQDFNIAAQKNKVKSAKEDILVAKFRKEIAEKHRDRWNFLSTLPRASEDARRIVMDALSDRISKKIVDIYRSLVVFEPESINTSTLTIDQIPQFDRPKPDVFKQRIEALESNKGDWVNNFGSTHLARTTTPLNPMEVSAMTNSEDPSVVVAIGFAATAAGNEPTITIEKSDLPLLSSKQGLSFEIRPSGQIKRPFRATVQKRIEWNSAGLNRERLIGTKLDVSDLVGCCGSKVPVLLLKQNRSWVIVNKNGKSVGIDPHIPPSLEIPVYAAWRKSVDNRPVFGTYTLRFLNNEQQKLITSPKRFKAKIHFVSVGTIKQEN